MKHQIGKMKSKVELNILSSTILRLWVLMFRLKTRFMSTEVIQSISLVKSGLQYFSLVWKYPAKLADTLLHHPVQSYSLTGI